MAPGSCTPTLSSPDCPHGFTIHSCVSAAPSLARAASCWLGRLQVSGTKGGSSGNLRRKEEWSSASPLFRHSRSVPGSRFILACMLVIYLYLFCIN